MKKALASSEAKVQQLMKVNNNLSEELRRLQKEVGRRKGRTGTKQAGGVRGATCSGAQTHQNNKKSEGESRKWELIYIFFIIYLLTVESNRGQEEGWGDAGKVSMSCLFEKGSRQALSGEAGL